MHTHRLDVRNNVSHPDKGITVHHIYAHRETFTSTSLNPQTTMTFSARRKEEVKRTYNYSH